MSIALPMKSDGRDELGDFYILESQLREGEASDIKRPKELEHERKLPRQGDSFNLPSFSGETSARRPVHLRYQTLLRLVASLLRTVGGEEFREKGYAVPAKNPCREAAESLKILSRGENSAYPAAGSLAELEGSSELHYLRSFSNRTIRTIASSIDTLGFQPSTVRILELSYRIGF
jgi:hypothetical protein